MSSKVDLPRDLEEKPPSSKRDRLLRLARGGHFHDFESILDFPKTELRRELLDAGFPDLAERAIRGHYDDDPTPRMRRGQ